MEKFVNCIKNHWGFALITIFVTIGTAVDLVTKYIKGHTIILSFIQFVLKDGIYYCSQRVAIPGIFILVPWVVAISLCILVVKDYFEVRKGYKDIIIYFIGQKLIVRFYNKRHSKEYAPGVIICGSCRLLFGKLPNGVQRCSRCGLGYESSQVKFIIAEARSKWITGKKQEGYIKTGKSKTH